MQVQSLGWEDPLEKGMVTHSGILARRIPEEPGGPQSTESQSQTQLKWLCTHAHGNSMANTVRICQRAFQSGCIISHSHQQRVRFQFLHILANTCCHFPFDYSPPCECEMVSHCGFALHFLDGSWGWLSFPVLIGHFYIFFGKMPVKIFCQFLIGSFVFPLLSCKSSSLYSRYKLFIRNMTVNILSCSRGCLSAFLMVSFFFFLAWIKTCKEVFNFAWSLIYPFLGFVDVAVCSLVSY